MLAQRQRQTENGKRPGLPELLAELAQVRASTCDAARLSSMWRGDR